MALHRYSSSAATGPERLPSRRVRIRLKGVLHDRSPKSTIHGCSPKPELQEFPWNEARYRRTECPLLDAWIPPFTLEARMLICSRTQGWRKISAILAFLGSALSGCGTPSPTDIAIATDDQTLRCAS